MCIGFLCNRTINNSRIAEEKTAVAYNTWLHRTGTLLIISALVCATYTNVFAGQAETDGSGQPLSTTANVVFMPLVQNDPAIKLKEEDSPFVDRAMVESVAVFKLGVAPIQINAVVSGNLPSACLEIYKVQQQYVANQIRLNLFTRLRLDRQFCVAVLTPFAESVTLDLGGLAAGDYQVVVQAVQAGFTLTADEVTANQLSMPPISH
jgi:hypothetical protein